MATKQPEVKVKISAEGTQAVSQALKKLQQEASTSASSVSKSTSAVGGLSTGLGGAALAAAGLTAALAGVYAAMSGIAKVASAGIDFNRQSENTITGLAAIISGQAKLQDAQGKTLQGVEAFNGALTISQDLYKKLQLAGLETAATSAELGKALQSTLSVGLGAGITDMQKLLDLTIMFTQTASAMSIPLDMLNQEIASILSGNISQDSTIAQRLQIKNEDIKKWKEQNKLVEELTARMGPFSVAAKASADNFDILKANASEAFDTVAGAATKGLFESLKKTLSTVFDGMIDKAGNITPRLQQVADTANSIGTAIGNGIGGALSTVASWLADVQDWFGKNKEEADLLKSGVDRIGNSFTAVWNEIVGAGKQLDILGGTVAFVRGAVEGVALAVAGVADAFGLVIGAAKAAGAAIYSFVLRRISDAIDGVNRVSALVGGPQYLKDLQAGIKASASAADKVQAVGTARLKEGFKNTSKAIDDFNKNTQKAVDKAAKKPVQIAAPKITGGKYKPASDDKGSKAAADKAAREAEALAKARLDAQVAASERERKLADATRSVLDEKNKQQYDEGLITLDQYLASRQASIRSKYGDEIKLLEDKIAIEKQRATKDAADRVDQAEKISNLENEIKVKQIEQTRELAAAEYEASKQRRENATALLVAQQSLLEAQGKTSEAARLALQVELEAEAKKLTAIGMTSEARSAYIEQLKAAKTAAIDFDEQNTLLQQAMSETANLKSNIDNQQTKGALFSFEAEKQKLDLERSRIPVLEQIAARMQAIAEASGNASQLQAVRDLNSQIEQLKASTDESGLAMAKLKDNLLSGTTDMIENGLMALVNTNGSVADSFKGLARSVLGSLQQMLAKMIAVQLAQKALGAIGGTSGGASFLSSAASLFAGGFADGGLIQGPGNGTSDSIVAAVSNGEFVVNAEATRRNLALLHALNSGSIPRFATGGLVGQATPTVEPGSAVNMGRFDASLGISLDEGVILQHLQSSGGEQAILNVISRNKNRVKRTINN